MALKFLNIAVRGVQSMWLALVAVSIVIFGLIVRARGLAIAQVHARTSMMAEAGRRAGSFGALLAIVATPWLLVGLAASRIY
jgi:hypothetical protein